MTSSNCAGVSPILTSTCQDDSWRSSSIPCSESLSLIRILMQSLDFQLLADHDQEIAQDMGIADHSVLVWDLDPTQHWSGCFDRCQATLCKYTLWAAVTPAPSSTGRLSFLRITSRQAIKATVSVKS